jgi:hypothetical protein
VAQFIQFGKNIDDWNTATVRPVVCGHIIFAVTLGKYRMKSNSVCQEGYLMSHQDAVHHQQWSPGFGMNFGKEVARINHINPVNLVPERTCKPYCSDMQRLNPIRPTREAPVG